MTDIPPSKIWTTLEQHPLQLQVRMHGLNNAWRGENSHSSLRQTDTDESWRSKNFPISKWLITHYSHFQYGMKKAIPKRCITTHFSNLISTPLINWDLACMQNCDDPHFIIYIHSCSLLYSLTITGTLVGGTCRKWINRHAICIYSAHKCRRVHVCGRVNEDDLKCLLSCFIVF